MTDQDLADLEKALLLALERGADKITIAGAGGGRIDHTLTAMALLMRYHREAALTLEHDGSRVRALSGSLDDPGRMTLATRPHDTISLIAFAPARAVSLEGVTWPLEDAILPVGTHGVSNSATGTLVTLEIRGGSVLICHLDGGS